MSGLLRDLVCFFQTTVAGGIHSLCCSGLEFLFSCQFKIFFWMGPFLKSLFNVTILFLFYEFLNNKAGILVPPPENELHTPSVLKLRVLSTRPMKSPSTHGVLDMVFTFQLTQAGAPVSTFSCNSASE